MNNKAIKQKYTFDKDNDSIKNDQFVSFCITDCAAKHNVSSQMCEIVENQGTKKNLKQTKAYITDKISDYGMDLIALTLIFLIPTIPFWQL